MLLFHLQGIVKYDVIGNQPQIKCQVEVIDRDGQVVGRQNGSQGQITVASANFWWPYTMNADMPGYMYTLKVSAWPSIEFLRGVAKY